VVVRRDSRASSLDDLRGASWAYHEPDSHSGYHVVRWFLAQRNRDGRFFGRVASSGAHETSLDMIVSGDVDASAVEPGGWRQVSGRPRLGAGAGGDLGVDESEAY